MLRGLQICLRLYKSACVAFQAIITGLPFEAIHIASESIFKAQMPRGVE